MKFIKIVLPKKENYFFINIAILKSPIKPSHCEMDY